MMWNPFEEITRMHEEMDRLFGKNMGLLPYRGERALKQRDFRMPMTDVKETENGVIATFEIPGAQKENIELNVTDTNVEVKVEHKTEKEVKGKEKYSYETRSHQFYRSVPLPTKVKANEATATYKQGILRVVIPKKEIEKKEKKKIQIT